MDERITGICRRRKQVRLLDACQDKILQRQQDEFALWRKPVILSAKYKRRNRFNHVSRLSSLTILIAILTLTLTTQNSNATYRDKELDHFLYLPLATRSIPPGKSVVLFSTPKIIQDFDNPGPSIDAFFDRYAPFTGDKYEELILIFAVGNSEHILQYQGTDYWDLTAEWARYINNVEVFSEAALTYTQIHDIVLAFKDEAAQRGIPFKIFDQIDQAYEFCRTNLSLRVT